ncbi:FtsX-like permease family protein [Phytohabitans sp. ZYX-F-186]|uniref:FtsX-like permease family protein n=1 Tax=Phytohabitans maris TaxID=3071409 RepID=A0ABU0ZJV3_9ACTN|nr:FtsX-like permease family protein [Phytohabitans sp. ZYX-F-186]MDQ7907319.1 FtsX-like permease family protein [Phytohabitans sp. ZYX-F-186]
MIHPTKTLRFAPRLRGAPGISWLTALRIARREARRAKGRSALVVAMIALPVLALTFAAASYDMFRLRPGEQAEREMGAADARLMWGYDGRVTQDPRGDGWSVDGDGRSVPRTEREILAGLPAGSRIIPSLESFAEFRTAGGIGSLTTRGLDVRDPLTAGLVTLLAGRGPADDGEVALSPRAAERIGAGIGGTVQSADRIRSWTVTGLVEFPDSLLEKVVFLPGAMPTGPNSTDGAAWLWDAPAPVSWEQVKQLNQRGMVVFSRDVFLHPPPASQVPAGFRSTGVDAQAVGVGGLVAGLAILEIVLLAGPAFAVGARRRRRDLGLVAANGGTPAHLRRIVLADGVVLGALGAGAGLVLGVAVAFLTRPLLEVHVVSQRAGGYRAFPLALAGIAALAVGTGLLAALVPAFTAARGDVVAALTGRRGSVRSRKRWLVAGVVLAVVGAAVTFLGARRTDINAVLAGLILGELGLVLCTPALVGLIARLGRVLPLAPRIALRDTARNRAASAPAIAAVMAAVAGSVALGVVLTAEQERDDAGYRAGIPAGNALIQYQYGGSAEDPRDAGKGPDLGRVAALAQAAFPVVAAVPANEVACAAGTPTDVYCGLTPRLPAERECPWADDGGTLSAADQRKARQDPRCAQDTGWSSVGYGGIVATPDALAGLTGATGDDLARAEAAIAAGGVVLGDPRFVVDGKVTLEIYDARQQDGTVTAADQAKIPTVVVPGYAVATGTPPHGSAILSSGAVAAAKLAERPAGVVVVNSRTPTTVEEDRLTASLRDLDQSLFVSVERGPSRGSDPMLLILAGAAGLITLGAAGIATGLAAADGRSDLSTLAAVGASPGVRRRLSLSQSGVIAGLGTVLGVAAGLGVSAAVLYAYNQAGADRWPVQPAYPVGVPWGSLAVVAVVPLVAMLGAGLLTRSRLPIEARRAT